MSLGIEVSGLSLSNPSMLASGIMGETGLSLSRVSDAGVGALVTKSIGMEKREGNTNPTLVELPFGYINSMGLPNPGIEYFEQEMNSLHDCDIPVVGSIFAADEEEFRFLAKRMEGYGASAVELNLSCPHARGYGMELGINPDMVKSVVEEVKSGVSIPVFAKLTPNTHRIVEVGKAVQEGGGDGVVAVNTVRAMAISVEFQRPILSNIYGGLSGPAIKPIGVRVVYELFEELDIPIIGVGGIEDGEDALEYIMAGASAFQVGSAVGRRGLGVFLEIIDDLQGFMDFNGYDSLRDIVGIAHE